MTDSENEPVVLRLTGVVKTFPGVRALDGVELEVRAGEVHCLLGQNGAGKSTLNRTLSGVMRPWQGRIRFDGEDIERKKSTEIVASGLIHVPEGRRIFPNMTVRENIDLGSYRRSRARRRSNRERVFEIFPRLAERQAQRAGTLSGGEQQMLAIGRGLMAEPRLLILDEPGEGLDPEGIHEMRQTIMRLHRELGLTLLISSGSTFRT